MFFPLPFDGPLHWALEAVVTVAVFVVTAMLGLRKHRLPSPSTYFAASPGTVPDVALAALQSRSLAGAGFRSLGVLTIWPRAALYAFAEIWVDAETSTTVAQTMFVQSKPGSTPVIGTSLFTCLGSPTAPKVVGVTSTGRSVTSGSPPGDEEVFLPGMSPAQLSDLHRLQLAARPDAGTRLPCASLGEATAVMGWLDVRSLEWRLATGRVERGSDGELHLSWAQCAWWVAGYFPPGRQIRRWRRTRMGERTAASWRGAVSSQVAYR